MTDVNLDTLRDIGDRYGRAMYEAQRQIRADLADCGMTPTTLGPLLLPYDELDQTSRNMWQTGVVLMQSRILSLACVVSSGSNLRALDRDATS